MRMYMTKRIDEDVDNYLKAKLTRILVEKGYEKNVDYLQVFTISNNELVVSQEQPEKKESFRLSRNYDETTKIFAIKNRDDKGELWTILFPDEY